MQAAPQAKIHFGDPPDRLIVDGADGVMWSGAPTRPHDAATLLSSIKTARNNLFHGDKVAESDRDTELMVAALFILNAAYDTARESRAFDRFVAAMRFPL